MREITESTRELAQRRTGSVEVLLLWHPESDGVELWVHDLATAEGFEIRVPRGDAMNAFRHPYAYAARQESSQRRLPRTEFLSSDDLIRTNHSKGTHDA
jgi:hypothetical protein